MKKCRWCLVALLAVSFLNSFFAQAGGEDRLTLPGVIADKSRQLVVIDAVATGMPVADPVEFVFVNANSGHQYEALAATKAKPGDVRKALEHIGLAAGRPVNIDKLQFWPRGDRLDITIEWQAENEAGLKEKYSVPIEKMLIDRRRADSSFPTNGFVFVGSVWIDEEDSGENKVLAADVYEPRSIVSTYNEPVTLIDVSWRAPQGVEYGHIMPNPEHEIKEDMPLKIKISPRYPEKATIETDLSLKIMAGNVDSADVYVLRTADGDRLDGGDNLKNVLSKFAELTKRGAIPYVAVSFGENLTAERIKEICALLGSIDNLRGIRIEPPPEGQLYYKAFLPDKALYDRQERGLQPPELHLSKVEDDLKAVLKKGSREWDEENPIESEIVVKEWSVEDPVDFEKHLAEADNDLPVLLIYVSKDITYGEIMEYIRQVEDDFPTVFVLVD